MDNSAQFYQQAAESERRLDALISAYAPQVVEALNIRGYPAYLEIIAGNQTPYGYQTANFYLVHVPGSPSRTPRETDHYVYLINESVINSHGNPGCSASYIISDIQLLTQGMYVQPESGSGEAPTPIPVDPLPNVPSEDLPTGSEYYSEPEASSQGDIGSTAPVSVGSESTPSSGTIPTEPAKSGLLYELSSVAQANGFDPTGEYNGYEIGWFYSRTPSASGYDIGPTELEIGQDERITLLTATGKIASYLSSGPTKPKENTSGSDFVATAQQGVWKQVAVIGGMILASVVLVRAITA